MEYIDQYLDGLPDDFFNDTFAEMVHEEKNIIYQPGAIVLTDKGPLPTTGIFVVDVVSGEVTTGRKYPVANNYDVPSDLEPSTVVFDWVKAFYSNDDRRFPHVPRGAANIPPSRYEKHQEFDDVYAHFIAQGRKIYMPTKGQVLKYPKSISYEHVEGERYVCNTFSDFNKCDDAVMLDFNPFNPTGIMTVKEVVVERRGVRYKRLWKDKIVDGFFDRSRKRYHYDVWGGPILGKNYYGAVRIRAFDIIVKHYSTFEREVRVGDPQFKMRQILCDPVHVEPYRVVVDKWKRFRSNLRYEVKPKSTVDYRRICLPWNNYDIKDTNRSPERFRRINDRYLKIGDYNYSLNTLHNEVKEIFKIPVSKRDKLMNSKIELAERVFVLRRFVSAYDGEVVKRDEYCSQKYLASYIYDINGEHNLEFVPYHVSRYPRNLMGTLVPSIFSLSIEEFLLRWKEIYKEIKFPGWLEPGDIKVQEYEVEIYAE